MADQCLFVSEGLQKLINTYNFQLKVYLQYEYMAVVYKVVTIYL